MDDDPSARNSLQFMLRAEGYRCRTFESAASLLDAVDPAAPGCLITDLKMPEVDGLQLVRMVQERDLPLVTIVITGHGDVPLAVQAMKAGALDFIEKPFDSMTLLQALRHALEQLNDRHGARTERALVEERLASLTARERQVLDRLVQGMANKVIAEDLGISPRTVEIFRANVMSKMDESSLSELVRMALTAQAA